ncbi:MAG: hypothetical protein RQM92_02885 [Candidatus Syntrophopropionicum ammoniitolerans]
MKGEEKILRLEGLVLHHYPDLTKSRENYLPLLELSVSEDPGNDRAMFWLGREYVYRGEYNRGIEILTKHLALPSARWKEERSASMRLIAQCYEAKGNKNKARAWLFRALGECPDVREPYLGLVRFGYREETGLWYMQWPIRVCLLFIERTVTWWNPKVGDLPFMTTLPLPPTVWVYMKRPGIMPSGHIN